MRPISLCISCKIHLSIRQRVFNQGFYQRRSDILITRCIDDALHPFHLIISLFRIFLCNYDAQDATIVQLYHSYCLLAREVDTALITWRIPYIYSVKRLEL